MVAPQGIKYAVSLIAAQFGNVVAKVCECLIHRGSLSFMEVVRFTELSQGQVKNCLLVLIQHNCVQAFSVPKTVGLGGVTKPTTLYMAVFDNVIHRMRFSKFLLVVKEHLGNQYTELLEGFLQHGRLTFQLLYDRASGLSGGKAKREDVLANFNKLVHAHYVERCPKGEPFLEPKADDDISSVGKQVKSVEETRNVEQEAIIAAAPLDADRFSGIMMNTEENLKHVKNDSSLEVSAGNKRKHEVLEAEEDIQNIINTNEVLWRANYEKFLQCLKRKACVANVRSRFGLDAAIVLEAMIESSNHQNARTMISATSSMNSIIENVRGKPGGISLTLELVRAILDQLGCRLCTEESETLYTVGLKDIIETCQNDEVESLVFKKYGKEAYRIFRLLIMMGRLVTLDVISDSTFLEKKEAQKILCKLWRDDYLEMEKVNLNAGGRTEVFLWKANKKLLWEHVLNDMFHAALNISQKIAQVAEEFQVPYFFLLTASFLHP
ncbi:DNA-directed RNA polymerase III subunit RPC3 [Phalaenopsis equestris]|uniref:DNA-directed RNA polymerase III subunit RPC3 n=1 Tax=Phalaenopsis equestris TaxID=78828 RepID=UPI0009E6194A|nr:DNA-directed RNA polymerase III subunit RPC3 [Phalaenopsis equestris]